MSSTWIDTPPEHAKEVIKRLIDSLGYFTDQVITYEDDCEVYFGYSDLVMGTIINPNELYYGYFHGDVDGAFSVGIVDGGNQTITLDNINNGPQWGYKRPCIWNQTLFPPLSNVTFIGYKFNMDYVRQSQQRIRLYNPSQSQLLVDIGTFNNSQDDSPISLYDSTGWLGNYSIYQTPTYTPTHIEIFNTNMTPGWWEIRCDNPINYADINWILSDPDILDIELIACQELTSLNLTNQAVPISTVKKILSQLAQFQKTNGTLVLYTGYVAQISDDVNYQTLVSRGWTITG